MQRKIWIDILKGIGIISVVAGHTFGGLTKQIIFLFHMPLFFFLSGYLYKQEVNIKLFIKDKAKYLLLPYISFLFILYIPFSIHSETNNTAIDWLYYFAKPIIGGQALTTSVGVFWFITCLFFTQQIFNLMILKLNKTILNVSIIIFLSASYINSLIFPEFWLPWNLNVIFASIPIFYIGYLLKLKKVEPNKFLIFSLSTVIIISVFYFKNNTYDMKFAKYGIPIVTLFSSITLILLLKQFAVIFSKLILLKNMLSELGQASMIIMYLHIPIQLLVKNNSSINQTSYFILSIIIPYILYKLILKNTIAKVFLLGSKSDFHKLFSKK